MRVLFRVPRWGLFVGLPLLLVAVALAVWGIDTARHSDRVARNVTLAGETVGGLNPDEIRDRVGVLADRFSETPILIRTAAGETEHMAGDLGVSLDVDATVGAIEEAGRSGGVAQPLKWLNSFGAAIDTELRFSVDLEVARNNLHDGELLRTLPTEPTVAMTDGVLAVIPGTPGQGIDVEDVLSKLPAAVNAGGSPIIIEAELTQVPPKLTPDDMAAAVAEANELIGNEITVQLGETTALIDSTIIASWFEVDLSGEQPSIGINADLILPSLEQLLAPVAGLSGAATFDVVDGEVVIVAVDDAEICCAPNAPFLALDAVNRGLTDEPLLLPGRPAIAEDELARLEALGIIEEVGTFTTPHACCQGRVTNIQRFADIVRGAVILPGESLSLNDHVGRRTTENGFVAGGFISKGVLISDIGGGVSQFATTIFNAAFFSGLEFDTYQAHSIYFSRYPFGREATISFPEPDLKIRNNTEYGVLVWPTYNDTSITVTMYSTKHVEVEASEAVVTFQGQCRRATTTRTRTYEDGTQVIDTVFAVYRPSEGRNCDGSASDPSTTTTTVPETTVAPTTGAPTTGAPTSAAPTTAPPATAAPPKAGA
ncbi:MAG: vancomycin resistance protein YoaR [Candidatus Poriferisodalaceae bacterium]